ncbi:hypothetical protein M8J77_025498 [Diaphorina citri]|nr:hypothetical protein M8J77_025498 [Diaphorina citri]
MSPKANQTLQTAPQLKDKEPIQENPKDNQQPTQPKFNQPQSQHTQAAESTFLVNSVLRDFITGRGVCGVRSSG